MININKFLKISGVLIFVTLFIYCLNLVFIFPWTPEHLLKEEKPERVNLVVILEGENYSRVNKAFTLVMDGYANLVFYPGLKSEKNKQKVAEWLSRLPLTIEYYEENATDSTYEEAIRTGRVVKEKEINSLILVTSTYHSYRAWWIFKKVIPGVKILSVPVSRDECWFSIEKARDKNTKHYAIFRKEQTKFALYYFLYGWQIF